MKRILFFLMISYTIPYPLSYGTDTTTGRPLLFEEERYEQEYQDKVMSLMEQSQTKILKGVYGLNLFYRNFPHPKPKANLIIVHGFTERSLKFAEMSYYFWQAGYHVHLYDQRGHGQSDRLLKDDDQQKIYVASFDDYVEDLKHVLDSAPLSPGLPTFIFAHSMGGGVVAKFLKYYPDYADAVVLSTPMIQPKTDPFPVGLAKSIGAAAIWLGQGHRYALTQGPQDLDQWSIESLEDQSQARFTHYRESLRKDGIVQGGATFQWLYEAIRGTQSLTTFSDKTNPIQIPLLLFQASNDTFVESEPQKVFCELAATCELVIVNASHELYRTKNAILEPYLKKILNFFQLHEEPRL